jgi:predicted transcriptional regulator
VKKKVLPNPTNAELSILRLLWELGPSTVRQVHKALNQGRKDQGGYTTALKLLQIMYEKGLVERDESQRPQVYRARLSQEQTQKQLVSDLLDRAFGGSAKQLVMQALAAKEASDEELTRIEQLLDEIEGGER